VLETKVLEIRDADTCIPALAIKMRASNETQSYYVHARCGYPRDGSSMMLMRLCDGLATNDPYEWPSITGSNRTMLVAHNPILRRFDSLSDGDVMDVQYLLAETSAPKRSERVSLVGGQAD